MSTVVIKSPFKTRNLLPLTAAMQFAIAPPVPRGSFSSMITTSAPTSILAKYDLICSAPYPAAMITLLTRDLGIMRIECSIKVVSNKGTSGLGTERVHGLRRVPNPPAKTIASMMMAESSRS